MYIINNLKTNNIDALTSIIRKEDICRIKMYPIFAASRDSERTLVISTTSQIGEITVTCANAQEAEDLHDRLLP